MAIIWEKLVDGAWVPHGSPTHEGRVLHVSTRETELIPGEWVQATFATVWDLTGGNSEECIIRCEGMAQRGFATEDATLNIRLLHLAEKSEKKQALDPAKEEEAEEALREVKIGSWVEVYKGRKVPKGTRGVVSRIVNGGFGRRALIETQSGNTHWTAITNLRAFITGVYRDETPIHGWEAHQIKVEKLQDSWKESFPKVGDRGMLPSGKVGVIEWTGQTRIRVKTESSQDWANVWDFSVLSDGLYQPAVSKQNPACLPNPLEEDPAPYCDIRYVSKTNDEFLALDAQGRPLMRLTEERAKLLCEMIPLASL